MSRVSRPSILVLLAVTGAAAIGSPAASASDANLKALAKREATVEKQLVARAKATKAPTSTTPAAFNRFYRRAANYYEEVERRLDGFRSAFAHEVAETPEAERGRLLMLRGLRDGSNAADGFGHAFRRAASRMRSSATNSGLRRSDRLLERDTKRLQKLALRGNDRVVKARKIIRNAPAPTTPAG